MIDQTEPQPIPATETTLRCVGCLIEHHAGQRDHINPATLIVGGNSTCDEHVQVQQGPAIPGRTPSGLIIGNGS